MHGSLKAFAGKSKAAMALTALGGAALLLSACSREGELDVTSGVGVFASLDGCPVVAIPNGTGDITLFNPASARTAEAIDIVASMTNVRGSCQSASDPVYNQVTFDVLATRTNTNGARQVTLPYYSVVMQAGENVVAKRVGEITLNFAAGQAL